MNSYPSDNTNHFHHTSHSDLAESGLWIDDYADAVEGYTTADELTSWDEAAKQTALSKCIEQAGQMAGKATCFVQPRTPLDLIRIRFEADAAGVRLPKTDEALEVYLQQQEAENNPANDIVY